MAKRKIESQKHSVIATPDHLAAGAAELRSRAKACRITSRDASACRRLEAAADLLAPEPGETADGPTEPANENQHVVVGPKQAKGRKGRRSAEVAPEVEDDADLDDLEFDADLDDEEA